MRGTLSQRAGVARTQRSIDSMSVTQSWKEKAVTCLAREIGVLAEIIVDDVIFDFGLEEVEMAPRQLMSFLARLQRELPETVDREAIIQQLANELLST